MSGTSLNFLTVDWLERKYNSYHALHVIVLKLRLGEKFYIYRWKVFLEMCEQLHDFLLKSVVEFEEKMTWVLEYHACSQCLVPAVCYGVLSNPSVWQTVWHCVSRNNSTQASIYSSLSSAFMYTVNNDNQFIIIKSI